MSEPQPASTWRRDATVALAMGLMIFAITLFPYLLAYWLAPAGKTFNGFFYIGDDATTYIAKMREGADGAWGWSDPYISRPVAQPVLLFLFYIVWGKVAALLHISLFAAYHLARLSGAIALVWAVRLLARETLGSARAQAVALVLAMVGSGAGYIAQAAGGPVILGERVEALDLHLPELSGFYSILAIPHFAWAAALMGFCVVALLRLARVSTAGAATRPAAWATLAMLALTFVHPQMLFVLAPLAVACVLVMRGGRVAWLASAIPFAACAPLLLYFVRILSGDEVVREWSQQWRHQAPGPLGLLLGLGLPLALALVALLWGDVRRQPALVVMTAWVVLVVSLLYLPNPVNIQRRLLDGLYLPIAVLAAAGLEVVIAARSRRRRGLFRRPGPIVALSVGLSLVSTVVVWSIGIGEAASREKQIYLDSRVVSGIDWLNGVRGVGLPPAVLSDADTGLFIPARSGLRVYVGHYSETLSARAHELTAVGAMRSGGAELLRFMDREGLEYYFYGPNERKVGAVRGADGLRVVYSQEGVEIFRREAGAGARS